MNYSLTQGGNLVVFAGLIVWALKAFLKIEVTSDEATNLITAVLMVVGLVSSWLGRFRQGDITVSGFKK